MAGLTKRDLEHLAELARIKLDPKEEEKLLNDLRNILEHFNELQELDTSNVAPMAGGTDLINAFRADADRENTNQGGGADAFPVSKDGFNKVPPVFGGAGGAADAVGGAKDAAANHSES